MDERLHDLRIERAKRLLADGDHAVEALSADVGYETPAFGACSAGGPDSAPAHAGVCSSLSAAPESVGKVAKDGLRGKDSAREHFGRLRASTEVPTPLWT